LFLFNPNEIIQKPPTISIRVASALRKFSLPFFFDKEKKLTTIICLYPLWTNDSDKTY